MTEHFYWIWAIFFIIPLVSIIRRYLRKRNMQNFSKSSEQYHEMQFKTNSSKIETPRRNLQQPEPEPKHETKDMQVFEALNYGAGNFEKIQGDPKRCFNGHNGSHNVTFNCNWKHVAC